MLFVCHICKEANLFHLPETAAKRMERTAERNGFLVDFVDLGKRGLLG
jgi:hypothetical protein